MKIGTLAIAFLIAFTYVGWPIIGRFSGVTGEYVGILAVVGTLASVVVLSTNQLLNTASLTYKAVSIMLIAGAINGLGVYLYSLKAADKTIPTAAFVATVCIFMVMVAPLQHWLINGVAPTWRQAIGYGLAALAVYFLK